MSPRINFDDVPDGVEQGDTVPDGTYPAIIQAVIPGTTKNGVKWDVFSEITEGPEKGKRIKDMWLWYEKGLQRTKACISGCELTQPGEAEYRPEHFVGCPIFLDVQNVTRTVGKGERENEVSECKPRYRGYSRDPDREWNPATAPVVMPPDDKQGSVFGSSSVPF